MLIEKAVLLMMKVSGQFMIEVDCTQIYEYKQANKQLPPNKVLYTQTYDGIPSLATLSRATLCLWDMYPRKEKTTKPEKKLVKELMELVMIASLDKYDPKYYSKNKQTKY